MVIKFYKTSSERNRLNKALTNERAITGHLVEHTSITDFSVTLKYDASLLGYNYARVDAFNRYYYITDISIEGDVLRLTLSCDVLMSHRNDILNSVGTITRSNKGNKYLNDGRVVNSNRHTIEHRKIGNGFTNEDTYIVVIGGGS